MLLGETLSTNRHDISIEAAMTGAFVFGQLMALVAAIVTVLFYSADGAPAQVSSRLSDARS